MSELQVGRFLAEWVRPLELEPLVSAALLGSAAPGHRARSPDFGLRLPGGDLFAEATVLRVGALVQWEVSRDQVREEFTRRLARKRVLRSVQFELPLPFDHRALPRTLLRNLAAAVADSERGEEVHTVAGRRIVVRWRALAGLDLAAVYRGSPHVPLQSLQDLDWRIPAEDISEQLLKSLRNTLKGKRDQFPHEAPYMLVLRLGHWRMDAATVEDVLQKRIWPNGEYGWLTGVALFTPQTLFQAGSPPAAMRMLVNPNARSAPTPAMRMLFEGAHTFRDGAPQSPSSVSRSAS